MAGKLAAERQLCVITCRRLAHRAAYEYFMSESVGTDSVDADPAGAEANSAEAENLGVDVD